MNNTNDKSDDYENEKAEEPESLDFFDEDTQDSDEEIKDFDIDDGIDDNGVEHEPSPDQVIMFIEKRQKQLSILIHVFAFAVPFMLMLIAYATIDLFPFGGRQIMVVDSWHQYFPFLKEFQTKLLNILNGTSPVSTLFYSWNIGSGVNFLVLMSYYASTPLYLFSVLFPQEYLREFMMITTLVKIGCSGLFFSIYLRGVFKKCDFAVLGFSVLYALSAYAVGYYWCLMWLDSMALLPLVILGLNNILENGKHRLYVISLATAIVSNYYAAFFVCVFVAFYYVVLYFSKSRTAPDTKLIKKITAFIIKTLQTVAFSLLGTGLAGFILAPTFMGIQLISNLTPSTINAIESENTLLDVFTNLLTNTKPAIRAGLPNIACGLIVIIFAALFFANQKIKLREKILNGTMLLFLIFGFTINYLNYYWHAKHFPNEIPYRQAFVFSFLFITVAYKAFTEFDGIRTKTIGFIGAGILVFLIAGEQLYENSGKFDFKVFYVNIALLAVYMAVIALYRNKKISMRYFTVFLLFIMMTEGTISAINGASATGSSDRNNYVPAEEEVLDTISRIYEEDEDLFYRLELSRYDDSSKHRGWWTCNDPALYGYRGITQFSSMSNSNFTKMLETLGIAASPASNRYLYVLSTPVFNMMMSLKYVMLRNDSINSVAYEEVWNNGLDNENVIAYRNKYWLPLGFMVSDNIWKWDKTNSNIFIVQNDFMKVSADMQGNVFRSIYPKSSQNVNAEEVRSEYGVYSYRNTDPSKTGQINHTYLSEKNQQVYMYIKAYRGKKATVRVNNGRSYSYEINRGITIDCGYLREGDEIKVSFDVEAGDGSSFYIFVAGFDEEVFRYGYDKFKNQGLQITSFTDTKIKGNIYAEKSGVLFTSIPYEKGWHAKVNGVKTEIDPIDDAFVAVILPEGEHEIEFYYITDGLIPGVLMTLSCLMILVGLFVMEKYSERKNRNRDEQQ